MNKQNDIIKSFTSHRSRVKGEKLEKLKYDLLPKYEILSFYEMKDNKNIELEIGSGFGQTVSHLAKTNPQTQFIACEVFIDGVASICSKLEENAIENVIIYRDDARILLKQIANDAIENVYLLFPDPWPKKKHHKRRIVTNEFLEEVARVLKSDGKLFVATDDSSYQEWMIDIFQNQSHLQWLNSDDYSAEPSWWVKTKFQLKAEMDGRTSAFFVLGKV